MCKPNHSARPWIFTKTMLWTKNLDMAAARLEHSNHRQRSGPANRAAMRMARTLTRLDARCRSTPRSPAGVADDEAGRSHQQPGASIDAELGQRVAAVVGPEGHRQAPNSAGHWDQRKQSE